MNDLIKDILNRSDVTMDSMGYGEGNIEKLIENIIDEVSIVIIECDKSSKMILHNPYRSILSKIEDKFK